MSEQRRDRFRRLERPRAAGPDGAPASPGTDARIEAVRGPGETGAPGSVEAGAAGHLDRFRPAPERELELEPDDDAQPFLRCAACETDSFRHAATCTTCGADLTTEPQRLFNQRLWAARQAEAAAEAEAIAARKALLDADRAQEGALRRRAAETLAREVGDAERRRLEREGFGSGWSGAPPADRTGDVPPPGLPPAIRWLRLLPAGWPVPAGVALMLLPVLLYAASPAAGLVAGAVVFALFTPPGWRWRQRPRP